MAKVDFSKVEENLRQAMHTIFVKKIEQGMSSVSERAADFYRLDETQGRGPTDSVIEALEEMAQEGDIGGSEPTTVALGGDLDTTETMRSSKSPPKMKELKEEAAKASLPTEKPSLSPLFLLRRHLLWFAKNRIEKIYELLGTTKEEVQALRKKEKLTETDQQLLQAILQKAEEVKRDFAQKMGLASDEDLISKEREAHRTKRFNVKKSWIPLR
jgi:hypothetical protein